jgi:hypothetical protein
MRVRILSVAVAGALLVAPVHSDDVFLRNGRSFEGVIITSRDDSTIRIRLGFGELGLPMSLVERVELGESALSRYLERRAALVAAQASAREWLELALWARSNELQHGYREAAVTAAEMDPILEGLAPHLRRLGYELDEEATIWVPYKPVPPAPPAETRIASPSYGEAAGSAADTETEESLSRAVELLAAAQLERERRQPFQTPVQTVAYPTVAYPVYPYVLWHGWRFPDVPSSEPPPPRDPNPSAPVVRRPRNPVARALLRRQPGSVIPLSALSGH